MADLSTIEVYLETHDRDDNFGFVRTLYQDILRREPDEQGFEHHLSKLNGGVISRRQLVDLFLNSEEYLILSGQKSRGDEIIFTAPLSPTEREHLYFEKVLKQDTYDADYADPGWLNNTTHEIKAAYVMKYLKPKRVLEVGCAQGNLVGELRKRGCDAWGIDYSETFVAMADQETKPFVKAMKVEDVGAHFTEKFDLLICTEVLEHLPLSIIDATLPVFRLLCEGTLLITVPSHGPNRDGRYGFPMHHVENWVSCARENRTFSSIPVHAADGMPHCGHITLGSYEWWTDKFLQHGFVRDFTLEKEITYDENTMVYSWPWCVFVLRPALSSEIEMGTPTERQLGAGIVSKEVFLGKRVAWMGANSEFFLRHKPARTLLLSLAGGPAELVYPRFCRIVVYVLGNESDRIEKKVLAEGEYEIMPGSVSDFHIDLEEAGTDSACLIACEIHVRNTWRPDRTLNSFVWGDEQKDVSPLGVGLIRAQLV